MTASKKSARAKRSEAESSDEARATGRAVREALPTNKDGIPIRSARAANGTSTGVIGKQPKASASDAAESGAGDDTATSTAAED